MAADLERDVFGEPRRGDGGDGSLEGAAGLDPRLAQLKHDARLLPSSVDGQREATWIVADYLDVVLHVFTRDAREYYRLEDLWGDVPSIELEAATA